MLMTRGGAPASIGFALRCAAFDEWPLAPFVCFAAAFATTGSGFLAAGWRGCLASFFAAGGEDFFAGVFLEGLETLAAAVLACGIPCGCRAPCLGDYPNR